ncbi:hypothetical protein DVH05_008898 [Phytophthora capsici]|nr:hypothetical protein DVH05_008898 [Phytophthora capsici]
MQYLDAISLGVFSYLQAHERVSRVEAKPLVGATQVELRLWEQVGLKIVHTVELALTLVQKNSPFVLPDDLKLFYLTTNGLSVKWFTPFRGKQSIKNSKEILALTAIQTTPL